REIFEEDDLLVAEGARFLAENREDTDERGILNQPDRQQGARAAEFDQHPAHRIAGLIGLARAEVRDVDEALARQQALMRRGVEPRRRSGLAQFRIHGRYATRGDESKESAVVSPQLRVIGLAQPDRLVDHRLEYRREVAGRRIDDLQYLGGRGLLFQRLPG